MKKIILQSEMQDAGLRIDSYLAVKLNGFTRSQIQKLLNDGHVISSAVRVAKNHRIKTDEIFEISLPDIQKANMQEENIPLDILFEDRDLVVINKPKGMVVHPAAGHSEGTLVNALLFHCKDSLSGIGGVMRPGIVHRIDKDTSGLLIVAKNDFAHLNLSAQLKNHKISRVYHAVVYGTVKANTGTVSAPIGRDSKNRKRMSVTSFGGKHAITHFNVITKYVDFSHLELNLETGRTHQIRVHMKHIGHPIAGDAVYGPKKVITKLNGQCLHAAKITFSHPSTGETMFFETPLPQYFTGFLEELKLIQ